MRHTISPGADMAKKDSTGFSGASSIFHALLQHALSSRMDNDRSALMAYIDCIKLLKQDASFCAALSPIELGFDPESLSGNFKLAPDDYAVIAVSDFDWCDQGRVVRVVSAADADGMVRVEILASSIYGVVVEEISHDALVAYKKPDYSSNRSMIDFIKCSML